MPVGTPPVVTYLGIDLAVESLDDCLGKVFYTEFAWLAATAAIHVARQGRLPKFSASLIAAIRRVRVDAICFGQDDHMVELDALLHEMEVIRWDRVWRCNGKVPKFNHYGTPVYDSGDYVEFDPQRWATQMPDSMYIEGEYDRRPCEEVPSASVLHTGFLNHCVPNPVLAPWE